MDDEKEDLEYGDIPETEELLFRPNAAPSRHPFAPFFKITAAILIGALVFFITLLSLDPSFREIIIPKPLPETGCVNPIIRREWRDLNKTEQHDFLSAIQCLGTSPSRLGLESSRYDDFVWFHLQAYLDSHKVAPSMPWHRNYIHVFEKALKEECGLKGNLPYWDWALDAALPEESPIWDLEYGMGGNGTGQGHCLVDGPFAEFKPQYPNPHCLQRNFYPQMYGLLYTVTKVNKMVDEAESYDHFRTMLEMGPHRAVHNGIGGEMPTDHSSNDPIFWVHHAQIDRLWWRYQQRGPKNESMLDYQGPLSLDEHGWPSKTWDASLDDVFNMYGMGENITVRELMSTETEYLCYRYEDK